MIAIVCNIDEHYTDHCIVMCTSVICNNPSEELHFYIIAENLPKQHRQRMCRELEAHPGVKLHFCQVDATLLRHCSVKADSYISMATYYRCFVATLLPQDVHKVIYLDCDLIVHGSLRPLWDTPMADCVVAAVEDMWSGKGHCQRLHYPEEFSYFNAGVLLINLDLWRKRGVEQRLADFFAAHGPELVYYDQDALNAVLYGERLLLPFRWNMQDGFFRRKRRMRPESLPELEREMPQAVIIHFTGDKKPWQYACRHPYKKVYQHYLDLTNRRGERPKPSLAARLNRPFLILQEMLGLKNGYRKLPS